MCTATERKVTPCHTMYTGVTEEQRTWTAELEWKLVASNIPNAISALRRGPVVALAAALAKRGAFKRLPFAAIVMSLARQHEEEAVWRWFED